MIIQLKHYTTADWTGNVIHQRFKVWTCIFSQLEVEQTSKKHSKNPEKFTTLFDMTLQKTWILIIDLGQKDKCNVCLASVQQANLEDFCVLSFVQINILELSSSCKNHFSTTYKCTCLPLILLMCSSSPSCICCLSYFFCYVSSKHTHIHITFITQSNN